MTKNTSRAEKSPPEKTRNAVISAVWHEIGYGAPYWAAQEATDRILMRLWLEGYKIVPVTKKELQ